MPTYIDVIKFEEEVPVKSVFIEISPYLLHTLLVPSPLFSYELGVDQSRTNLVRFCKEYSFYLYFCRVPDDFFLHKLGEAYYCLYIQESQYD